MKSPRYPFLVAALCPVALLFSGCSKPDVAPKTAQSSATPIKDAATDVGHATRNAVDDVKN